MTSVDLSGKRILFIAPRFFGYEQDILQHLRGRGAHVDWLPDRPFDTPFMTAVTRFGVQVIMPAVNRLYRERLETFAAISYDIVLVINGQTLSRDVLLTLRRNYPKARFILYMWDSIGNRSSILGKLDLFDELNSFDAQASKTYGMHFRHLFFGPGFEQPPATDFDYDLSFIGTAHTDRFDIISKVDETLSVDVKRYWYLYLQAPWVFWSYKVINPGYRRASLDQFKFDPLPKAKVQSIFSASRAIVDIEHPRQSGLTMRALETFGASKKLITTNTSIMDADFYDPANICVIDRRSPVISQTFLNQPFKNPPADIYKKYKLSGWIDEILRNFVTS
jgi:hypothetical protein